MIAKGVEIYCCEDISLIENYEQAANDKTQIWHCHHRLGVKLSAAELIEFGLYWNRPASELIFLTPSEHHLIHSLGKQPALGTIWTEEQKANIKREKNSMAKAVYQIDRNTGEIIKVWKYIKDAATTLGINYGNIVNCCKGRYKHAGGFKWKYVE